jgi:hypothetical protein
MTEATELPDDEIDTPPAVEVLNAPKRIWLCVGELEESIDLHDIDEVTWCDMSKERHDVQYVRADLVERMKDQP